MRTRILANTYRDSGTLMTLAAKLQQQPGVTRAMAIMATPRNRELLATMIALPPLDAAPGDLLVVVEGEGAEAALAKVEELLVRRAAPGGAPSRHRTAVTNANLAMISVPGPFAAREARKALRAGLHVFLFSNGVALDDEISLKTEARERGLLLKGPDCGTAIIDGVPIGFANRVRRGTIGIVGASGTGIQEVSTLIHRIGGGITHAIGTGSRDLSDAVGGAATLHGIELLAADDGTDTIVLVSKPPSPAVAERVLAAANASGRRVVTAFVGGSRTLEDAAFEACNLPPLPPVPPQPATSNPQPIIGLFSGGTLGSETRALTHGDILDLGDEELTRGRPHPMIDPTIRIERIRHVAPEAALLLDIVLGEGSHPDPAGALVDALRERDGLTWASVCGTELDPQQRDAQVQKLLDAGVLVARSNAAAARFDQRDLPHATVMPPARAAKPLLGAPLSAINLGLDSFADTLDAHNVPVARIDWRPPAGGDEELARMVELLMT
ncbi:MAG: sucD 2 [Acidobacteria bacterium]|nr:sucD 2 [Acidobacteriota bacterium]